jgi:hypothetical protein
MILKPFKLLSALVLTSSFAQCKLLLHDDFCYTTADLSGGNKGCGWNGVWHTKGDGMRIVKADYKHPGSLYFKENAVENAGEKSSAHRNLDSCVFHPFKPCDERWISFIHKTVNSKGSQGNITFHLGSNPDAALKLILQSDHQNTQATIQLGASAKSNTISLAHNQYPTLFILRLVRLKPECESNIPRFSVSLYSPDQPVPNSGLLELTSVSADMPSFSSNNNSVSLELEGEGITDLRVGTSDADVRAICFDLCKDMECTPAFRRMTPDPKDTIIIEPDEVFGPTIKVD